MGEAWTATEEGISVFFFAFSFLLALVLVLSKFLHDAERLASVLPEAGMILLVGIVAGFFLVLFMNQQEVAEIDDDATNDNIVQTLISFSPKVFFMALLPPIIFNSGYHLRRELFLRFFTPICLFACLGTFISGLVIAFMLLWVSKAGYTGDFNPTLTELLTFGALISATDPVSTLAVFQSKRVDPHLFYLVFGESVMNDAVGLVLFNAFAKFVRRENNAGKVIMGVIEFAITFLVDFVGSTCLGIVSGILAAMLLKYVDMRQTTLLELSVYILIMYVPFLLAEMLHLSGIVTILFSGIAARRYVVPNLSEATDENSDVFFRLIAHLAETSIFLELGLSVAGLSVQGIFHWKFIMWALLACLVGRALNIYPISFFYDLSLRRWKSPETEGDGYAQAQDGDVEMTEPVDNNKPADGGGEDEAPIKATASTMTLTPEGVRDKKIDLKTATMLWFAGLRGAVAYACVKSFPDTFGHHMQFVATTMAIVLLTVFLLGGTTECVLKLLRIEVGVDEDKYMEDLTQSDPLTGWVHNIETTYIYPCVVRHSDMTDLQHEEPSADEEGEAVSPDSDSSTSFRLHEQVEMTQSQYLYATTRRRTPRRRAQRASLYDYGLKA